MGGGSYHRQAALYKLSCEEGVKICGYMDEAKDRKSKVFMCQASKFLDYGKIKKVRVYEC